MQRVVRELHRSCQLPDTGADDPGKATYLMEVYALDIQLCTLTKNAARMKASSRDATHPPSLLVCACWPPRPPPPDDGHRVVVSPIGWWVCMYHVVAHAWMIDQEVYPKTLNLNAAVSDPRIMGQSASKPANRPQPASTQAGRE